MSRQAVFQWKKLSLLNAGKSGLLSSFCAFVKRNYYVIGLWDWGISSSKLGSLPIKNSLLHRGGINDYAKLIFTIADRSHCACRTYVLSYSIRICSG